MTIPASILQPAGDLGGSPDDEGDFFDGITPAPVFSDTNKFGEYDLTVYPSEVGQATVPHWVLFTINVRKTDLSDIEQKNRVANVEVNDTDSMRVDASTAQSLNTAAGAVGGSQIGSSVAGLLGFGPSGITTALLPEVFALTAQIGGAVGGAFAGGVAGNNVSAERTKVVLKDAIGLYVPGAPSSTYSAAWGEEDLGILGSVAKNLKGREGFWETAKGAIGQSGPAFQAAVLKGSERLKSTVLGNIGGAAQSSAAITTNPFKAELFKSMGMRSFEFNYSFLPKNDVQYAAVQKVVKLFKKYMHPKLSAGYYILNYPAEFTITYYYGDNPNPELFKLANCALTNMQISYGGDDFITFRKIGGAPSEIHMKLQFTELEMLTQNRIDEGF